ncbi:MAG: hypothetical protein ABJE95_19145 [Byssovorax sp.]
MIVLQTDLSLPKDVNKVTIEVLVRGDRRHFNTFEKLGDSSSLQIPASIGLTLDVGTEASTPITFRVTAFQDTKARVLREVVTTIPKDRLVALKMPIQWLCWDQVSTPDAEGNVASSCGDGKTCIAGTCADNKVDPATLEDYSADKIFGGGTGTNNDGTCFDTAPCFASATDAPTTLAGTDCTIDATGDMNVAIRVKSAGICGANGCFVPIDAKSEFGWQPGDKKIKLPKAVCDRVTMGTALGVSVSSVTSACPLKTNAIPACGPWSSAGKPSSGPAAEVVHGLVFGQPSPASIAVRNGNMYWTNLGSFDQTTKGSVNRIKIDGGTPFEVLAMQAYPTDIAVDSTETHIAWSNTVDKTVIHRTLAGTKDVTLTLEGSASPSGLTFFGNDLLVTSQAANSVFLLSTGNVFTKFPSTAQTNPYRIATDGHFAFWTNEGTAGGPTGAIVMHDLSTMNPLPDSIIMKQEVPRDLALEIVGENATAVYWANLAPDTLDSMGMPVPGKGSIHKATIAGGTITEVAGWSPPGPKHPHGIAVDNTPASLHRVYWTDQGSNDVWQVDNDGKNVVQIAKGQAKPGAMDVDATSIYWVNEGTTGQSDGSVMAVAKPK